MKAKKNEVQGVIGVLNDERYKDLVNLSSKITDFVLQSELAAAADNMDETHGVAVILDRDEESEEVCGSAIWLPFCPLYVLFD